MANELINKEEENELVSYFQNEETELDKTIKEIDDLYDEVKGHYDIIKKASRSANGGRGVLSFIEKQTANLVSLKNSKASLIGNKITLKKYAADLALKQKKDMDDTKINNDLVNAVLDQIANNEKDTEIEEYNTPIIDSNDVDFDELLNQRIQELKDSGEIEEPDEDNINEEDIIIAIGIHDKKWRFIAINEFNEVIENYDNLPSKKGVKIKVKRKKDGSRFAVDQNNKLYKVIELEE